MLDIKVVHTEPDKVRKALKDRGYEVKVVDEALKLYEKWRKMRGKTDELNAQRNAISIEIGKLKKAGKDVKGEIKKMKTKSEEIHKANEKTDEVKAKLDGLLFEIPNVQHESVPVGKDEEDNKLVSKWGDIPKFKFKPKEHWELAEALGIIDFERGVKMAGHRFAVLREDGARLERALINFMVDFDVKKGYVEHMTPHLVTEKTMRGTGQLPKFEVELYKVERDGLYLIPTAEVTLTNMHADEILKEEELPKNYCAYTPCYRREAGAYGKDIRGIMRQHQFNKVELVKITTPERSYDELEVMVKDAADILEALRLPYQMVELCSAELGFASAKTYDLEVWLAGQNKYREISSCSNCTDFQARRINSRFWRQGKPEFVHTLNGSGIAVGRTMIAILENYQQKDGSVKIPDKLIPYFGKKKLD